MKQKLFQCEKEHILSETGMKYRVCMVYYLSQYDLPEDRTKVFVGNSGHAT